MWKVAAARRDDGGVFGISVSRWRFGVRSATVGWNALAIVPASAGVARWYAEDAEGMLERLALGTFLALT